MGLGAGLGFLLSVCSCILAGTPREMPSKNPIPQCGHWSILRCCQILGVPVEMKNLLVWLPPEERGHHMLALSQTLKQIGLHTEGRKETFDALKTGPFPMIAHLEPNHFVVIASIDDSHIYFFDGTGCRRVSSFREFTQQWTNKILKVWREPRDGALPKSLLRRKKAPCIQFETLLLDKGEIRHTENNVKFVFPFVNAGKADLIVQKVHVNCGCMENQKPVEPIPPGGQGMITLVYKTATGSGSFSHEALVQTNDPATPLVKLTAGGNTGTAVRFEPSALNLGRIVCDRTKTATWHIRYTGDVPLNVDNIEYSGAPMDFAWRILDVNDVAQYVPAMQNSMGFVGHNRHAVEMSFTPTSKEPGKIGGKLIVSTNIEGFEKITVPVQAETVLPVVLSPGILLWGELDGEPAVEQTITAWSAGGDHFRIVAVDTGRTHVKAMYSGDNSSSTKIVFLRSAATSEPTDDTEIAVFVELEGSKERFLLKLPMYTTQINW